MMTWGPENKNLLIFVYQTEETLLKGIHHLIYMSVIIMTIHTSIDKVFLQGILQILNHLLLNLWKILNK